MKNEKFLVSLFLLIISRAYDITTTWLYTPDLSRETNVIVKGFRLTIFSSILFQAVILSIVVYFLYVYSF